MIENSTQTLPKPHNKYLVIDSSSTLADVVLANEVTATSTDLGYWSLLTVPDFTEDDLLTNTLYCGLFGFDLSDFWTDC